LRGQQSGRFRVEADIAASRSALLSFSCQHDAFLQRLEEQPLNLIDNKTALTPRNIEWQIFVAFLIDFSAPSGNSWFDSLTFPLGENPIGSCCLSKWGQ
jgi:hypothetical protein